MGRQCCVIVTDNLFQTGSDFLTGHTHTHTHTQPQSNFYIYPSLENNDL